MNVQPITVQMNVSASDGLVFLDGEPGCAVTLTPEAAVATGDALLDMAAEATDQRELTAAATAISSPNSSSAS